MVNERKDNKANELSVTDDADTDLEDVELEVVEEKSSNKIKKLLDKIKRLQEEKQSAQDDLHRTKADFLNARKRLEAEQLRDRVRNKKQFITDLLPLCDSFHMAMSNKETWEKADAAWRIGIEAIHTQLTGLLTAYGVKSIDPQGKTFDPAIHEAVGTEKVTDEKLQDVVLSVIQKGYEMKVDDATEIIRPARVTIGIIKE